MYQAHHRVTLSGILGTAANPIDGFSFGFCTSATLEEAPANWEATTSAFIVSWFQNADYLSANAILREVKFSLKGIDGKDAATSTRIAVNQAATGPTAVYPYQVALAVSLGAQSDVRRAKGRFYLPLPTMPLTGAENRISDAIRGTVAGHVKNLLDGVATRMGESIVVASGVDGNHSVETVRVGNKLDTIRSRRNAFPETYSVTTLA